MVLALWVFPATASIEATACPHGERNISTNASLVSAVHNGSEQRCLRLTGEVYDLAEELIITRSLRIVAAGTRAMLRAVPWQTHRVLSVREGCTVELTRLVLVGGEAVEGCLDMAQARLSCGGGVLNRGQLTLMDSVISNNTAEYGAGGLYNVRGGSLRLRGSIVRDNSAGEFGGGLANAAGGNATLENAIVTNNLVSSSTSAGISNQGKLVLQNSSLTTNHPYDLENEGFGTYVLPAPPGRYLLGAVDCVKQSCNNPSTGIGLCPIQNCPPEYFGNTTAIIPQGLVKDEELLPNCSAGFFGNGTGGQTSSVCSGPCPAGYICPHPGTVDPELVQRGYYSPMGASEQIPCSIGTFGSLAADGERKSPTDACTQCPDSTTTLTVGSPNASACVCLQSFFDDLGRTDADATDNMTGARRCVSCALGLDCSTQDTCADALTKPLDKKRFVRLREYLMNSRVAGNAAAG